MGKIYRKKYESVITASKKNLVIPGIPAENIPMKEYLLLTRGNRKAWDTYTSEEWAQLEDKFGQWIHQMGNKWVRGDRLSPIRRDISRSGNYDGPFADANEAVGGFFIFRAENLDEATAIAKACPTLVHDGLELYELETPRQSAQ